MLLVWRRSLIFESRKCFESTTQSPRHMELLIPKEKKKQSQNNSPETRICLEQQNEGVIPVDVVAERISVDLYVSLFCPHAEHPATLS